MTRTVQVGDHYERGSAVEWTYEHVTVTAIVGKRAIVLPVRMTGPRSVPLHRLARQRGWRFVPRS